MEEAGVANCESSSYHHRTLYTFVHPSHGCTGVSRVQAAKPKQSSQKRSDTPMRTIDVVLSCRILVQTGGSVNAGPFSDMLIGGTKEVTARRPLVCETCRESETKAVPAIQERCGCMCTLIVPELDKAEDEVRPKVELSLPKRPIHASNGSEVLITGRPKASESAQSEQWRRTYFDCDERQRIMDF